MNFGLNYLSDQFVFWNLRKITKGYLQLIDSKGNEYFFGDKNSSLKTKLKINNPNFSLKLLRKGSGGLGESYINNEFETEDLSTLIELSARNINVSYKISGFLQIFSFQNFLDKNIFTKTRARSKKNISLHYDL